MNQQKLLNKKRDRRKARVRAAINGTSLRPRLSVFKSNQYVYAQLIDDDAQATLASASIKDLKDKAEKLSKVESARLIGEVIAEKAISKGIQKAVFDRGECSYHGRVKEVAEGARSKGLQL